MAYISVSLQSSYDEALTPKEMVFEVGGLWELIRGDEIMRVELMMGVVPYKGRKTRDLSSSTV